MAVSVELKKEICISRKMEIRMNSSKEKKSNEETVKKVGRAILKQAKTRKYFDMKGMEREREIKERNIKNKTESKKYQVSDTWKQCHVMT